MDNMDSPKTNTEVFTFKDYFWINLSLGIFFDFVFGIIFTVTNSIKTQHDLVIFIIVVIVTNLFYLAICLYFKKLSKHRIELNGQGISRLDENNQENFLNWDEVEDVEEERLRQRLVLSNQQKTKKLIVDFQFENFPHIQTKIFYEFEKRMKTPIFPIVFKSRFFTNNAKLIMAFIVFGFIFASICRPAGSPVDPNFCLFFLGFLIITPIAMEFDYFYTPTEMTVSETDISFSYFFGHRDHVVKFSEFVGVELDYFMNVRFGNKFYYLVLSTRLGDTYELKNRLGSIPKMYTTLDKLIFLKNNRISG
jgi:hypothetical protein